MNAITSQPATQSTGLTVLRWMFLIACWLCVAHVAWQGRWEGWLTHNEHTWVVGLEYAPVWEPPPIPGYNRFSELSELAPQFPTRRQEFRIERKLRWDLMLVNLMLDLWAVTAVASLVYLVIRGRRSDLILHCALSIAVCFTFAAILCAGLSYLSGGWTYKVAETFGVSAFLVGIAVGFVTFHAPSPRRRLAGRREFRPYGL